MARLKSNEISENIAEEFTIGNTKVFIHTDYCCNTTEEDVKRILERVARIALDDFAANDRSRTTYEKKDETFTEKNADSCNNGNSGYILDDICISG